MVMTRKNSSNNFIPVEYSPPKHLRGKIQPASTSKKPGSFEDLVAMGDDSQLDKCNVDKNDVANTKAPVDMTAIDREFEEVFANEMVADILNRCRIKRKTDAPRIPLCRILRNEVVRVVSKCDLKMREVFRNDGYLPEKGQFVLSMKTSSGSEILVSDVIKEKWDDYWKEINEEFENEIKESEDWKELSGRMFLCWDGNHRTAAWMEEIRSKHEFQFDKKCHISVSASFIDVEKCHVMQLISALNRINELNEDGVIHNTMKDTLYSVHKVATANPEQYRSKLDPQYLASLKIKDNASSSIGTDQWYQLPRLAYCKLLFQRQIDKEISMEVGAVKEGDDAEALKLVATKKVHERWVHKMGKLLAIVNPALGQSWFDAVTRADNDTKTSRLSIEKLMEMVKAKVPNHVRDRWVHWMSAGTAIHITYGIPKGDKSFKEWVKKEVWLEHVIEKVCQVFRETSTDMDWK